jgi:pterin-4a-carbinolamine dehydratase
MSVPTSDDAAGGSAAEPKKTHGWRRRERPARLECRHVFPSYDELRDFLDRAADLSDATGIHPNISFGRDYVNMTLFADEDSGELTAEIEAYAQRVDDLVHNAEEDGS